MNTSLVRRALLAALIGAVMALCWVGPAWAATRTGTATWSGYSPGDGAAVSSSQPPIAVTATDPKGLAGSPYYSIKIDGALQTATMKRTDANTITLSLTPRAALANGVHTVFASVKNNAGAYSTTSWQFTIAKAPTLSAPLPAPGSTSSQDAVTISAAVAGDTTGLTTQVTVDGVVVPSTFGAGKVSAPVTGLANDASHAVVVTVTNASGLSATLSWDFSVQIYSDMPSSGGSTCEGCHAGYADTHPMTNCAGCHGAGSPVGEGWSTPDYAEHPATGYVADCVGCHSGGYATVPPVHDTTGASAHVAGVTCAGSGCHVKSLTIEHARTGGGRHGTVTCASCHGSEASATVKAVMSAGWDGTCYACHPDKFAGGAVVPHAYDASQHTAEFGTSAMAGTWTMALAPTATHAGGQLLNAPYAYTFGCATCHDANLATEHGKASSAPVGATACTDCHPAPRNTIAGSWDKTCATAGCHTVAGQLQHATTASLDAHKLASTMTTMEPAGRGCSATPGTESYARTTCHTTDLVQEHNRKIGGFGPFPTQTIAKTISVSCEQCHKSAQYLALDGNWDGTCTACHTDSHAVIGTARYNQVFAQHQANRYYDGGFSAKFTGVRIQGINSMDAHGPVRQVSNGSAMIPYGCANQICHTQFWIAAGLDSYYPADSCTTCHGPNIAPMTPYQGSYMWKTGEWVDGADYQTQLTLDLAPITLPAASSLEFKTFYDIETDWDYGYVQVSTDGGATWTNLSGALTTTANPYGANLGNGITGSTTDWVDGHFDLSAYAGQQVKIRFNYVCDTYTYGSGWYIDMVSVGPAGSPVFTDDAETLKPEWTVTSDRTTRWSR